MGLLMNSNGICRELLRVKVIWRRDYGISYTKRKGKDKKG